MNMPIYADQIIYSKILRELGVIHGLSTKALGNMSFDRCQQGTAGLNQNTFFRAMGIDLNTDTLLMPSVQHSANVALVKKLNGKAGRVILDNKRQEIIVLAQKNDSAGIDACISYTPNTFLAILPADCAPIMFFEPISQFFGLIHAGSIGLAKQIIGNTIACLKRETNLGPEKFYWYVGPCICEQCYSHQVDLRGLIAQQLRKSGARQEKLEISPFCTAHDQKLFFSHHRAKKTGDEHVEGRNMAIIGLKK